MTDFKNLFDIRIYNYFLNHERLADFLNVILFDGQTILDTQDIIILDSNSSGIFLSSGQTIKRTRDHLLLVNLNGQQCLIGLEHQSYVDKGMFQRIMEYDYLSYLKQYHFYEKNIHERINGVMTLAIYYGERKWKYARNYKQMMNQSIRHLRRYMNVEFHPLVEMAKLDETRFQNKDNQDLITGMKILYAKKKVPEKFIVSHEVACLLGTLIHDERIYQLIEKKKGATNMSDHVLGIRKQGRNEGKNEERKPSNSGNAHMRHSVEHSRYIHEAAALERLCRGQPAQPHSRAHHCRLYPHKTHALHFKPQDFGHGHIHRLRIYLLCCGKQADHCRQCHSPAIHIPGFYSHFFCPVSGKTHPPVRRSGGELHLAGYCPVFL